MKMYIEIEVPDMMTATWIRGELVKLLRGLAKRTMTETKIDRCDVRADLNPGGE